MEFLRKEDRKRQRVLLSKSGNEVLWLSYPILTGDTPAARHTAALIEALIGYAEQEALKMAETALAEAIKNGRLFDFTRHTYDVSLDFVHLPTHVAITLIVEFSNGTAPVFSRKRTFYWEGDEQFQLKKPPRVRKSMSEGCP